MFFVAFDILYGIHCIYFVNNSLLQCLFSWPQQREIHFHMYRNYAQYELVTSSPGG